MRISNFSIQHKTTTLILIAILMIMGTIAYVTLPRESAPDITFPYLMVMSHYEGTSPSDMESLVTRPLERKLKTIADIKKMTSTTMEGSSQIFMEFEPDVDTDTALQKVKDKVDQAQGDLPGDMRDPTVVEFSSQDLFPIMFVVISGDVGLVKLKHIAEDIKEDIEGVKGVLDAQIIGDREREIRVEYDQDRLAAYGVVMNDVIATVRNNNRNMPGGNLDIGEARYVLKAPGEFSSPTDIDNLVISVRDGRPIYLTDVATVRDTFTDRESFARLNGVESVSIRITKRAGEHLLRIAEEIKAIVDGYREQLPDQITVTVTSDSSEEVHTMVSDLENNIVTGLILVLIVIFSSLGLRNALLVASAIPLSMLLTFFILQSLGITLNFVVLFSLILALGMLVDNAIVIVENIYRHHTAERKPLIRAAMEGTAEVAWPVIASTATTVAAFLPLIFWPGMMGQFMGYLPKTVIIALLSSLFVALIITPALSSIFIKVSKKEQKGATKREDTFGPVVRGYRRLLRFTLNYRALFLAFFFSLLVLMIYAYGKSGLGVELFPDTEPQRIVAKIKTPEGTNVQHTNNFVFTAEDIIKTYGNIESITTTVGNSGPNTAEITIDMIARELRKGAGEAGTDDGKIYFRNSNHTMEAIRQELVAHIVGADVKVDKQEEGPPTGAPINVEIHGEDFRVMTRLAEELQDGIRDIPGIVDLTDDYQTGLPEIKIDIDKERAALLGLDVFTIGYIIKGAVNGVEIGKYREGEDEFKIVARLPEEQRQNIQNILRLRISDRFGNPIPLSSVANVTTTSGLSSITHIDEKRVVTVSSNVAQGFNAQQVLGDVKNFADTLQVPAGYSLNYTGEDQEMQESSAFMVKAFIIAILLIALVLVTQFDSVLTPVIIMTSVILSFIGIFLGLLVTHTAFGVIMTGMGVISLAGVVVNNAIVLIDYINVLRKRGKSCVDAIMTAGCTRFRPVMLTAVTTVFGLIPMAIGVSLEVHNLGAVVGNLDLGKLLVIGSDMSQFWSAMAIAVIFGLVVATALTLFVVPCLYSLLFSRKKKRVKASEPLADLETSLETVVYT